MTLEQKLRHELVASICKKVQRKEAQRKRREHYNQLREKWNLS